MLNLGLSFTEALSDVVVAVAVDSELEPVIAVVISSVGNAVSVAGLKPGCLSHQYSEYILWGGGQNTHQTCSNYRLEIIALVPMDIR